MRSSPSRVSILLIFVIFLVLLVGCSSPGGTTVPLYFGASADFSFHLPRNIPSGLPLGMQMKYEVRLGDYINMIDDDIKAADSFTFTIVE